MMVIATPVQAEEITADGATGSEIGTTEPTGKMNSAAKPPRSVQQKFTVKQYIRNNYFRIAAQQVDLDRLAREQRNGKPIRFDDAHSAQALINLNQAWVDKQGNLHIRPSVSQTDLQAADRRLPVVLQQSVRVDRQNIQKLAKRIEATTIVAWFALILASIAMILGILRFADRIRRRGYYSY